MTVLKLFHDSREPWLLKDMEKAASKKGVVFQAVKDVVQSLVDDSLVHVDKIGTSNWYWSFPGAADAALRGRLAAVDAETAQVEAETKDIEERVTTAKAECPQTDERTMAQALLDSAGRDTRGEPVDRRRVHAEIVGGKENRVQGRDAQVF